MTEAQRKHALSRVKKLARDVRNLSAYDGHRSPPDWRPFVVDLAGVLAEILGRSGRSTVRRSTSPALYHSVPGAVVKRLRRALGGVRGKLGVADAMRLAGFPHESHYGTTVVGQTMTRLGWTRRRCRLDGKLKYAYVKGTPLQQEKRLDIKRGKQGLIAVPRTNQRSVRRA